MASIKEIATEIIEALGQVDNTPLYNRVKRLIIEGRAELIRRDVRKTGIDDDYIQYVSVNMIKVPSIDLPNVSTNVCGSVLRTKNRIPSTVRVANNTPFMYVGTSDRAYPYVYVSNATGVTRMRNSKYFVNVIMYCFVNGYIYIYATDNNIANITIGHPFINPHLIDDSNSTFNKEYVEDTDEFLIPEDMLRELKAIIFKTDFAIAVTDDREVSIDSNEKRTEDNR